MHFMQFLKNLTKYTRKESLVLGTHDAPIIILGRRPFTLGVQRIHGDMMARYS